MSRARGYRWLKPVVKTIVGLLVLVAVARHVGKTWHDLRDRGGVPRFDALWIVAAIALYLVGLSLYGVYFVRVLDASPTPVSLFAGGRAYLISHLGKYVPGKALVVVMRIGLVSPVGVRASTAAFATIYETLVMMASGGFLAYLMLSKQASVPMVLWPGSSPIAVPLGWVGLLMGSGFLVLVAPRFLPRLTKMARKSVPAIDPESLPRLSGRLLAEGLAITSAGWMFLGLSQVAVIFAISRGGVPVASWPAVIGSVALATVAGFVVPIAPGGLGVREWVLWTSLGSVLDKELAVLASLGLRLAWVAGEVLAAAILIAIRPAPRPRLVPEP